MVCVEIYVRRELVRLENLSDEEILGKGGIGLGGDVEAVKCGDEQGINGTCILWFRLASTQVLLTHSFTPPV